MTYTELRQALHGYMHREDPETVANETVAIEFARVKLNRSFFPESASVLLSSLAVVGGSATLPADVGQIDVVSTADGDLEYLTPREYMRLAPDEVHDAFSVSGSILHVAAPVNSVAVLYYRRAEATTTNNWLSDDYPDVWLWQAISEQHRYVQDLESAQGTENYAQELAQRAMDETRANKAGGALRMVTRR